MNVQAIIDTGRDNTNRNFRGQQPEEEVICFSRHHPIVLLRAFIVMSGLMGASLAGVFLAFASGNVAQNIGLQVVIFLLFMVITLSHHFFFLRLFHYFLDIVILTNYRLIDLRKSVFLLDDKEIIDLHEIQDIKKNQQGIWANLLNYGEIYVATASLSTSLCLYYMPQPEYYLNQINQAKRQYILTRRVQKGLGGESTLTPEAEIAGDPLTSDNALTFERREGEQALTQPNEA